MSFFSCYNVFMTTQIIILAAGKGTRMNSSAPKVLHCLNGTPMLDFVLRSVTKVSAKPVLVIGYQGDKIIEHTKNKYHYVRQKEQLGTGHAVACAKNFLLKNKADNIIVLPGDHPSITASTIKGLLTAHKQSGAKLTISVLALPNFTGRASNFYNFGRIKRDPRGVIKGIIELKDATAEEKNITEVNAGYYGFNSAWLWQHIDKLNNHNKAKEYYLTDLVKIAVGENEPINSYVIKSAKECLGVNNPEQLAAAEKYL